MRESGKHAGKTKNRKRQRKTLKKTTEARVTRKASRAEEKAETPRREKEQGEEEMISMLNGQRGKKTTDHRGSRICGKTYTVKHIGFKTPRRFAHLHKPMFTLIEKNHTVMNTRF